MVYHNPHRFFLIFLLLFRRTNWNRKRTKIKTKLEFSTFRADIQTTKFWILRIWVSTAYVKVSWRLWPDDLNWLGPKNQSVKIFSVVEILKILIFQILSSLVIMVLKMNLLRFYQMEDFQDLAKLGIRYEMEQADWMDSTRF